MPAVPPACIYVGTLKNQSMYLGDLYTKLHWNQRRASGKLKINRERRIKNKSFSYLKPKTTF